MLMLNCQSFCWERNDSSIAGTFSLSGRREANDAHSIDALDALAMDFFTPLPDSGHSLQTEFLLPGEKTTKRR